MVSSSIINTFGIPIGIWALRKGLAQYQTLRRSYSAQQSSITPLPFSLKIVLNILFYVNFFLLLSTGFSVYFYSNNLFIETRSRFQTPTDVIFARLAAIRELTPTDLILKSLFKTKEGRFFFLQYGPSILTSCQFCGISNNNGQDNLMYFLYALPSLLGPHIAHMAVIGAATSPLVAGTRMVTRFRTPALLACLGLAAGELYLTYTNTGVVNLRNFGRDQMGFFYWRARLFRVLAFCFLDVALGLAIWLAGTSRFLVGGPGVAQRLQTVSQALQDGNWKLWSTGSLRNALLRDPECKQHLDTYWAMEKQVYEQREVVNAMRAALERANLPHIEQNAESVAESVVNAIKSTLP